VTGVTSFGLFVVLKDYFVEGLVPISALGSDFFVYEEKQHRLRGRSSGTTYRPGRLGSRQGWWQSTRSAGGWTSAWRESPPPRASPDRSPSAQRDSGGPGGGGRGEGRRVRGAPARHGRLPRTGQPNPSNPNRRISHQRLDPGGAEPSQTPGGENAPPTRLGDPAGGGAGWSGIRIGWKDNQRQRRLDSDVPLGAATPLPARPWFVRADAFCRPSTDGRGGDQSGGRGSPRTRPPRSPSFEKGRRSSAGWIFTRFPTCTPSPHPPASIRT